MPCLTSFFVNHVLKCCRRSKNNIPCLGKIPRFLKQLPLFQPFVNFGYVWLLRRSQAKIDILNRRFDIIYEDYKNKTINIVDKKEELLKIAEEVEEENKNSVRILNEHKEMKLYSAFGEDAPQFCLQVAVFLETGKDMSTITQLTIMSSFFMFARAATSIYLCLPTNGHEIKRKGVQDEIIIGIFQLIVVLSRMVSVSIAVAYLKYWSSIPFLLYFISSLIFQWRRLLEDSSKTILGILTNIFGHCIVSDEKSKFFLESSLIATVFHIMLQTTLFVPKFLNMKIWPFDPEALTSRSASYITYGTLLAVLFLNFPLAAFKQHYIDPIYRLNLSLTCIPFKWCMRPNWNLETGIVYDSIKKFILDPTPVNRDAIDNRLWRDYEGPLIHQALKYESRYLIKELLNMGGAVIDVETWIKACKTERVDIVNIFVQKIDQDNDNEKGRAEKFEEYLYEENEFVTKIMNQQTDLGKYLKNLYKELYSVDPPLRVNVPSEDQLSKEQTSKDYKNLVKLQSQLSVPSQHAFKMVYDMQMKDACHTLAPRMRSTIQHPALDGITEVKPYFPKMTKAVPVVLAILDNDLDKFDFYLAGLDVKNVAEAEDKNKFTCLHLAALLGRTEMVQRFLESKPRLSRTKAELEPLTLAVSYHHDEIAKMIGAYIDQHHLHNGWTCLHIAAKYGRYPTFKTLSQDVEDKNPPNADGLTPLDLASEYGHMNIVKFILKPLTKLPRSSGSTPMHKAVLGNHFDILKTLIVHFQDEVNPADDKGNTLLHHAVEKENFEMVKYLLDHSDNPNPCNKTGYTPLHIAAEAGNVDILKLICEKMGNHTPLESLLDIEPDQVMNMNPKAQDGMTPLRLASRNKHLRVINFLSSKV